MVELAALAAVDAGDVVLVDVGPDLEAVEDVDLAEARPRPLGLADLGVEGMPVGSYPVGKRPKVTLMTPIASTGLPSLSAGFQR